MSREDTCLDHAGPLGPGVAVEQVKPRRLPRIDDMTRLCRTVRTPAEPKAERTTSLAEVASEVETPALLARSVLGELGTVHVMTPGFRAEEMAELDTPCGLVAFNSPTVTEVVRPAGGTRKSRGRSRSHANREEMPTSSTR